jgi:hypothetical protein
LKEAFRVMGPVFWIRSKPAGDFGAWTVPVWNVYHHTIQGQTVHKLFDSFVWTDDPSDETGKVCGVEVTP